LIARAQAGDEKAMDRLVISNLRICLKYALHYQGRGVELLDLFNEAVMGFMRGVMIFDPDRGAALLTGVVWSIRHYLEHAVALQSRTVQLTRSQVREWIKVRNFLEAEQFAGRHPGIPEIMKATGLNKKTVYAALINSYG
jgi:RNA polymerase sigma factor (sigma-70 family)